MPLTQSTFTSDLRRLTLDLVSDIDRNLRDIAKERRVLHRKLRALNDVEAQNLRSLRTLAPFTLPEVA